MAKPIHHNDLQLRTLQSDEPGLLLDFQGEPLDDEAYLRHCREFGLTGDMIARLLKLKRLDEALKEINASSDYDVMGHADRLIAHKHVDLAQKLVETRYFSLNQGKRSNNHWQLRDWLTRFYEARKKWPQLLRLCVEEFEREPKLAGYLEVYKAANKLEKWESLRPELLAKVPRDSKELIRIFLHEGDVAQSVELMESRMKNERKSRFDWDRVDLEVAEAAEKSHPATSIQIYRSEAEGLILNRSRDSYRSACEYLKKVKRLFSAIGDEDDWNKYVIALREQHRSLRALHEEMARAKL